MGKQRIRNAVGTAVRVAGPTALWGRLRQALPIVAQCAGAAGVAWWLASTLLGHPRPVFAAIAAIICLAGGKGERARQAVDLVAGVLAGVVVGEIVRYTGSGSGVMQVVVVVVLGMLAAVAIDFRRLAYIQGAASALVVLVLPPLQNPGSRFVDAVVGGALGLLGSQVLFTPDPVALVAGSLRRVLGRVEEALAAAARAIDEEHPDAADAAVRLAREARSDLAELSSQRKIAHQIRRRTVRGRRRAARLRQLDDMLDHVDVLVAATVLLTQGTVTRQAAEGTPQEDVARFLREAARDVSTAAEVLGERSRGHYVARQFSARVPAGLEGDVGSYARAIVASLDAVAPVGSRDGK
ncbi:FUSC family protein [Arthrobacter sp. JSM 101049]|uniref:FUSC family protein n=1 Tax=Arthrobacter sp. JSM 101049 TaxID=929097 RepID=UPI00356257F0